MMTLQDLGDILTARKLRLRAVPGALGFVVQVTDRPAPGLEPATTTSHGPTLDIAVGAALAQHVTGVGRVPPVGCDVPNCTFHHPKCERHIEEHARALANGMPPSGRHG